MRIAVSGTHFSGKSTLIASLLKDLLNYTSIEEPYFLLEEEGYKFSDPPSLEDFKEQCARSEREIEESSDNTLFDRCPLDFLAYAEALTQEPLSIEHWVKAMEDAIDQLDLIIFVPIEETDRIHVPPAEDRFPRETVDQTLRELLLYDSLDLLQNLEVLEVEGSLEKRVQIVRAYLSEKERKS